MWKILTLLKNYNVVDLCLLIAQLKHSLKNIDRILTEHMSVTNG